MLIIKQISAMLALFAITGGLWFSISKESTPGIITFAILLIILIQFQFPSRAKTKKIQN